jgi:hypothetical protein
MQTVNKLTWRLAVLKKIVPVLFLAACTKTAPAEVPTAQESAAVTTAEPRPANPDAKTAPVKSKIEVAPKVAAGERFPLVIYAPKKQKLALYVDGKEMTPKLPWSCHHDGAYVWSLNLKERGTRSVEVRDGSTVVGKSDVEVK